MAHDARQAKEDMRMNSRVCDLLVTSIVTIYSALAVVDVVGTYVRVGVAVSMT